MPDTKPTREHLAWAYRLFLDREPENESVVAPPMPTEDEIGPLPPADLIELVAGTSDPYWFRAGGRRELSLNPFLIYEHQNFRGESDKIENGGLMKNLKRVSWLLIVGSVGLGADRALAAGPYSYFPLTPCRFVDTRDSTLQGGAPLSSFVVKTFTAKGKCGIPSTARAISVNVTVASPGGAGFLTLYPSGVTKPYVSVVNWKSTDNALANGAVVPLGSSSTNDLSAYEESNGTGTVQLILDVTGYFQ